MELLYNFNLYVYLYLYCNTNSILENKSVHYLLAMYVAPYVCDSDPFYVSVGINIT